MIKKRLSSGCRKTGDRRSPPAAATRKGSKKAPRQAPTVTPTQ